jgi:glyoxylase-like metal-dependent hydrolase (beta-lactamase superfamily II)
MTSFTAPSLTSVRAEAARLPGALPVALNGIAVSESVRPRRVVVEGGDETPVPMPRTAFQLVYPDGTTVIDTGLDRATHDTFSSGEPEPYHEQRFAELLAAMESADRILLTHHHADHVGGLVTSSDFERLAPKTLLTEETAELLVERPHRPNVKLEPADVEPMTLLSYSGIRAIAPGLVLIAAAGHSPDSQMLYMRLESGVELLHCVDSAWHMDNIRLLRGKGAPWVGEDDEAVAAQLRWLKGILDSEPDVEMVISHDGELLEALHARGVVGRELERARAGQGVGS